MHISCSTEQPHVNKQTYSSNHRPLQKHPPHLRSHNSVTKLQKATMKATCSITILGKLKNTLTQSMWRQEWLTHSPTVGSRWLILGCEQASDHDQTIAQWIHTSLAYWLLGRLIRQRDWPKIQNCHHPCHLNDQFREIYCCNVLNTVLSFEHYRDKRADYSICILCKLLQAKAKDKSTLCWQKTQKVNSTFV